MALIDDIVRQNTPKTFEALAVGIPTSYNWYEGYLKTGYVPGAGVTALTGWLAAYPELNGAQPNYNAQVQTRNFRTWVRSRSGAWTLVQNLATVAGGLWSAGFAGTAPAPVSYNGSVSIFKAPPAGFPILHWWPTSRGTFTAGSVDASYTEAEVRTDVPAHKMVAHIGIDWWINAAAPFKPDFSNNPAAGIASYIRLTDAWRTVGFYTCTTASFKANLPAHLRGGVTPPIDPPVEPPVSVGFTGAVNWAFENGVLKKVEIK